MPLPINRNRDIYNPPPKVEAQDLSSLIPFLQNPFGLLSQIVYGDNDKKALKEIWLNSSTKEDKSMVVSSSVDEEKIRDLNSRGLLEIDPHQPGVVKLTREGTKLLNQTILSDEKCAVSFTKKASKDLVSKNSYDFGKEVLVRLNNSERYGFKYIAVKKSEFKGKSKPIVIDDYNIKTRDELGRFRPLSSYSESELIKVLHLAKRIIENHQSIRLAGAKVRHVPIHRIKGFAEEILQELNKR
jgi:hypothetical protein